MTPPLPPTPLSTAPPNLLLVVDPWRGGLELFALHPEGRRLLLDGRAIRMSAGMEPGGIGRVYATERVKVTLEGGWCRLDFSTEMRFDRHVVGPDFEVWLRPHMDPERLAPVLVSLRVQTPLQDVRLQVEVEDFK